MTFPEYCTEFIVPLTKKEKKKEKLKLKKLVEEPEEAPIVPEPIKTLEIIRPVL